MKTIVRRCTIALPDDYRTLVPKLLIETMAALGASFVSRINLAAGDAVPETKTLAKGLILHPLSLTSLIILLCVI